MADDSDNQQWDILGAGRAGTFSILEGGDNQVEGWVDSLDPGCWAYIVIKFHEAILGMTIANRFNRDAFAEARGSGWIGFKIDLGRSETIKVGCSVQLSCLRSGKTIYTHVLHPQSEPKIRRKEMSVYSLLNPVLQEKIECDFWKISIYIQKFRSREGDIALIRKCYRYILRREPDDEGIRNYFQHLRNGMDPVYLLHQLIGSDEFRRLKPCALAMPGDVDFPFAEPRRSR